MGSFRSGGPVVHGLQQSADLSAIDLSGSYLGQAFGERDELRDCAARAVARA